MDIQRLFYLDDMISVDEKSASLQKKEIKMENAILKHTPIYVDMLPVRDEFFTGICLKANENIFLIVTFDDSMGCYDGMTVLKNQEIGNFRPLDEEELAAIEVNNWATVSTGVPLATLNSFGDFFKWLKKSGKLISIFTNQNGDSYYVGKVLDVMNDAVEVKLIDENGKWFKQDVIGFKYIDSISFDTFYERELTEKQSSTGDVTNSKKR